jgi:uncharacterized Zn-finger protein
VLEREIVRQCEEYNKGKTRRIFLDLCFHDYAEDAETDRIVSTYAKAKNRRNIKFLKLHGSLNWLICSYCGRVFVDYRHDTAIKELSRDCFCRYCSKTFVDTETTPQRHSLIITPTFIKDLGNLHLKNIWHNAFIDLTEADHIVFIGYSFPPADFEMQCLFKKALKADMKISVILHKTDNPNYYEEELRKREIPDAFRKEFIAKLVLPETRYRNFFGGEKIRFAYQGLEGYIEETEEGDFL